LTKKQIYRGILNVEGGGEEMEETILNKLVEMDKKTDDNKNEITNVIRGYSGSIGNAFARLEAAVSEKFKETNRKIDEVNDEVVIIKHKIGKIDEKIDILYASDVLTKKILDNHEHRIKDLEIRVADAEDETYNNL